MVFETKKLERSFFNIEYAERHHYFWFILSSISSNSPIISRGTVPNCYNWLFQTENRKHNPAVKKSRIKKEVICSLQNFKRIYWFVTHQKCINPSRWFVTHFYRHPTMFQSINGFNWYIGCFHLASATLINRL